jgi:hypothetical protein
MPPKEKTSAALALSGQGTIGIKARDTGEDGGRRRAPVEAMPCMARATQSGEGAGDGALDYDDNTGRAEPD